MLIPILKCVRHNLVKLQVGRPAGGNIGGYINEQIVLISLR